MGIDGAFHLSELPPGRYGLKAGHDSYEDPHVPKIEFGPGKPPDPNFFKPAEPWQGAAIVTVKPGETTRGVIVDFKPPPPIVEPPTDDAKG